MHKRKSVKYTWFVSYLLVLIVPILTCLLLFMQMQSSINAERMAKNEMQLSSIIRNVETEVMKGAYIANYIRKDTLVIQELALPEPGMEEQNVRALQNMLVRYKQDYSVRENLYLYFEKSDLIVSEKGLYEPFEYYQENYKSSDMPYADWKRALLMRLDMAYRIYSLSLKNGSADPYQNTLQFFLLNKSSEQYSSVLVVQGESLILPRTSRDSNEFKYAIFDKNGEMVYFTEGFGNKQLLGVGDQSVVAVDGKKYILNRSTSADGEYTYIVALDYYEALSSGGYLYVYIALVVLSALLSVALLWRTIRHNYTFIDRLVATFSASRGMEPGGSVNEIDFINRMAAKLDKENSTYNKLISVQNKQLKANYLSRLLRGSVGEMQEIQAGIEAANDISFPSDYFAVILFLVEDYTAFFEDDLKLNEQERIRLVRYAIGNVAEEMAQMQGNQAYIADMEEIPTMLVSFAPIPTPQCEEQLRRLGENIRAFMESQLGISLSVSMSHVQRSLYGISIAHKEALDMMDYKFVLGAGMVISPDDVEAEVGSRYLYTNEREQALTQYIRTGNNDQAALLAERIFAEIDLQPPNLLAVRCLCFDIAATLLKIIGDAPVGIGLDRAALTEKLLDAGSAGEMKAAALSGIEQLCSAFAQNGTEPLVVRVSKLLEEEYGNPELSVSLLAERLHMHHTYLSNAFKTGTGVGLLEYINRFRVRMACSLLCETSYNIEEIAERVGYLNASTFARVFKKYMGMTASEYRSKGGEGEGTDAE